MELTLIPVTPENRAAAEALTVGPGQEHFIETVAQCLAEADQIPDWRPMLLCLDGEPIGFAMYGYMHCEPEPRLWFDRFLIDHRYQHRGLGRQAVQLILDRLHRDYPGCAVYLSAYEDNETAIALYRDFGFAPNGELDINGETVMMRPAL